MSRSVLHKSRVIQHDHTIQTTTLCGRNRLTGDGMNITGSSDEVTCKFCLRMLGLPVPLSRGQFIANQKADAWERAKR
jgi:hypothetical protein